MTPAGSPDGIPELSLKPSTATPPDAPPRDIGSAATTGDIPELSLSKKDGQDATSPSPSSEAKADAAAGSPPDKTAAEAQKPAESETTGAGDKKKDDDEKKDAEGSGPASKKKSLPGKYGQKKGGRPLPLAGGKKPGTPPAPKPKGGTATKTAVGIGKTDGGKESSGKGDVKATKPIVDANGVLVTHTGLMRIKARKASTIYIIIGIAVVLSLIPIYFGTKAMKSGFSRMSRKPKPAARSTRPKDPATTARQEAAQLWSPYDDEFRGIKAKVAKLPWNSAAEIDVHIAIWQEFIDSHPDADPNDKCIKLAREQLKNMQDLRAMW
jgi:hypothetical protein